MAQASNRAGAYTSQPTGYRAFVPAPLPPVPPLALDDKMLQLLSQADRALGRLDGSTEVLPNPDLFVMMFVKKEAVLSSQIEGTQASLADVLEQEANVLDPSIPADVVDVINYVKAVNYGLERLATLPLSLRLVREIHEKLMEGTRGQERLPGEFRSTQNWIGAQGCTLTTARFVPPSPGDMMAALSDWETFLHGDKPMPYLIKVGLAHAQFETIHPFLDGNGRVGRLLITFLLCQHRDLARPLLYLSHFFKANRLEYYDRLQAIRDQGDWEGWIRFFLRGIAVVANEATTVAKRIVALREEERARLQRACGRVTSDALKLHELLFERPYLTIAMAKQALGRSYQTANKLVSHMEELGILQETTGQARNRVYLHERYFRMFDDTEMVASDVSTMPFDETVVI